MAEKYGDISKLIKDAKKDPKKEGDNSSPPTTEEGNENAGEKQNNNESPAVELNEIVRNQFVKKTFEIKLVHEIAIESLKADRKKKSRFNKSEKTSLTNNGIMDEIIEFFFQRPENAKYIQAALQELSEH